MLLTKIFKMIEDKAYDEGVKDGIGVASKRHGEETTPIRCDKTAAIIVSVCAWCKQILDKRELSRVSDDLVNSMIVMGMVKASHGACERCCEEFFGELDG